MSEEAEYVYTCPKCGEKLIVSRCDYSPIGGEIIYGVCPRIGCDYNRVIAVRGKIPEELARKIYPGYMEVF